RILAKRWVGPASPSGTRFVARAGLGEHHVAGDRIALGGNPVPDLPEELRRPEEGDAGVAAGGGEGEEQALADHLRRVLGRRPRLVAGKGDREVRLGQPGELR